MQKAGRNFSVEEMKARARVALAAKANLNAAVTVALLSAPASLGNTVGIAVQRMIGAAFGCLAAAGIAALGHGVTALVRGGGRSVSAVATTFSSLSSPSSVVSALVQATAAVILGTLAVYIGQRARIQYGAQLFGVSMLFVLAQSGASPGEAWELALSRGGGVVAGAALAAALAVAVLPQSAARGSAGGVKGALFGVADLAEAALGGGGGGGGSGGGGEKEEGNEEGEDKKGDVASPPPSTSSSTTAAARRVLSSLSELDECLAWAPAETAVRAPRCLGGEGGGESRGGGGGRLLFYLHSLRASLGLAKAARPPVPIDEIAALSLSLRAATSTLTTIGAVRALRLPRSVREAVSSAVAVVVDPVPEGGSGVGDGVGDKITSSPSSASGYRGDTFELIAPAAVAAWEALGEAWRARERLRRLRRGGGGEGGRGDDLSSSFSFSGAEADAAVAALSAAVASANERARSRAAASRALALKETIEEASTRRTYRGMFERALPTALSSASASASASSPSLAARARSRFLAEIALSSKVARDAERALECLRAAVEAL